ncbi:MAG: gliding motility-associated C-terminal domain-containing protein [Bacteroidia bacterium]
MLRKKLFLLPVALLCAGAYESNGQKADYTQKWEVKDPYTHNVFIENKGQFPDGLQDLIKDPILFYSIKGDIHLYFSGNSVTFLRNKAVKKEDGDEKGGDRDKNIIAEPELMSMTWEGANANVEVTVDKETNDYFTYPNPYTKNHLPGITAHAWNKLTYHNLYNGIDMVFYFPDKGGLEYDIIAHPGADLSVIKMNYTGAKALLKAGDIYFSSECADITMHAPKATDENGRGIESSFSINKNTISFKIGKYDRNGTLTIDPWVSTTSFTSNNAAYDIGYDYLGNVYVFGGGTANEYQLQKYSSSGALQWTYTPSTWPEGGGFYYYYGDLVTDTRTGDSYINAGTGGGFSIAGAQIDKVSPGGSLVRNFPGDTKEQEMWRMDLDYCHNLLIIGAGDAGSPPYQAYTIDTAFITGTAINVLATDSPYHDMALLGLDQMGHAYMATAQTAGETTGNGLTADNVFLQLPIPSLAPTSYMVSDGYDFQEISSISYFGPVFGGSAGNGINGMAANKHFVVSYDGKTLEKWTTTGSKIGSKAVPGGSSYAQGGLDLDCDGHVYTGSGANIYVYDSTLATNLGTIATANTVYDLKVAGNGMVYACGKSFVGAYVNPYMSKMITISSTAPTACAACNGQATVNVNCGSGNYTYQWSNGATTSTITGLCQGIYTVTVTDAGTCGGAGRIDTASVKFILGGGPTVSITSETNALCNGGGGGSATASASGGVGPYTYSWSPSGQTNATATNLSAGTYTVTVKNGSGCISIDTVTVSQPQQISIGMNISPSCSGNNGSATAVVTGGTGPYTYSWSPSGGTNVTASGLASGTTYTVTVTDKNGCTQTQTAKITSASGTPPTVTTSHTNSTCSVCDGTATANASGGTAPYTYSWSNGDITSSISNLCGGTYTVSVSSAGDSVVVPFYTESFTGWTLNVNGSTPNGSNANEWVIDNNSPTCGTGNYLHIACSGGSSFFYTCTSGPHYDPGVPGFDNSRTDKYAYSPVISTVGKTKMTLSFTYECNGSTSPTSDYGKVCLYNGTTWTDLPTVYSGVTTCTQATVAIPAAYDGLSNFQYGFHWVNSDSGNGSDPPFAIDSITIGSKSYVSGCPTSQTVVIPPSGSFSVNVAPTNASCGSNNGMATAIPTPTGTYTYKWNDGQTTQTATGLAAGTYTVIVSVAGGCSDTTTVSINSTGGPTISSITRTDELCNGGNTGTAIINIGSGASPYTYSWSSGQTTSSVNNLAAGTYTCTVTDKNGCQTTDTVIITQPTAVSGNISSTAPASCGSTNGSATVSGSGGAGSYTYSWSSGSTGATANNLASGNDTCTITDANGCSGKVIVTIGSTGGPTVNKTTTNPLCHGGTGSAIATITSGTGPFSYTWLPTTAVTNHFDSSATNLPAGTYTCIVKDKNGCATDDTIIITQPAAISASVGTITPANCGSNNGSANIIASGGTGALSYIWSPAGGATATATGLAAGSYTCKITDANGCDTTITVGINNSGGPTLGAPVITDPKCNGAATGTAIATVTSGSLPFKYSWSPPCVTLDSLATSLKAGTYICTVTDKNGCVSYDTIVITQPTALTSTIKPVEANCGKTGSATVTPSGGTGPYSYSWSTTPVQTTQTATNLTPGTYSCTITDANGCTEVKDTTITGSSGPVVTISPDTTIAVGNTVNITATGGGTYLWTPPTGLGCDTCPTTTASPEKTTSYCVLVTDKNGCTDSTCMTISVNELPCGQVFVPNAFSPNGVSNNQLECVFGNCIETIDFSIYDRWGNRVFYTTDPQNVCWDGKYNGQLMNTGVFVYYLDATTVNGAKVKQKGNVTLIR